MARITHPWAAQFQSTSEIQIAEYTGRVSAGFPVPAGQRLQFPLSSQANSYNRNDKSEIRVF